MVENDLPIGEPLLNILATEDQTFQSQELCLDRVKFIFATQTISLEAIVETDEIKILQTATIDIPKSTPPNWGHLWIGKKLQTLWVCENAQGYLDQVIFAFGHLYPSLSLVAEGSVLKLFQSQPIPRKAVHSNSINAATEAAIAEEIARPVIS